MSVSSIVGIGGRLEVGYVGSDNVQAPVALFLHPEARMNGSMDNKIIYSLFKRFSQHGYSCLRFNYRGVGRSEGVYDNGEDELLDAATALDYLQLKNENSQRCCIVGYSFGALIAIQLIMRRPEVTEFLLVAPLLKSHDFEFTGPSPDRGLVVVPEHDEECPMGALNNFVSQIRNPSVTTAVIEDANHFFSGKENALLETLEEDFFLNSPPHLQWPLESHG